MTKYLERYGGFSKAKELGLLQWQLAIAMALPGNGEPRAAADVIALMMVMVEQSSLDGNPDIGWLLTLQNDPPSSIFLDRQNLPTTGLKPFSSLADPKWIATMLSFVKEQDSDPEDRRASAGQKADESKDLGGREKGRRPCLGPRPDTSANDPCQVNAPDPACLADSSGKPSLEEEPFNGKLSFLKWAAALPRLLLATRAAFARFFCSLFP